MSVLTAAQRGDLAESMLPVAATLTVLVHGDGGPEDVHEALAGLDDTQRTALIVVLAGLVDPEQRLSAALGWVEFDEEGALAVPRWDEKRTVRDLAEEQGLAADPDYVDPVAVRRYLAGSRVPLTDLEFLSVLEHAAAQGVALFELDRRQGAGRNTHADRVNRLRKAYQRAGGDLPAVLQSGEKQPEFTDAQVVEIREKYAAGGVTDLELSMQYGRTRKSISALLSGASYRNAGGPIRAPRGPKPKEASRAGFARHTGAAPTVHVAQAS
ncbi:hypothetical protein ACGFU4_35790 [Streptomyces sp. NPDC048511]|uniref:hypothetical protein n=1 Tax=Streptomyces sp. NPDC048511 TaxID=3365562 RepID=UPI003720AAF9